MQPLVWTTPWALAGLAAIPALVAIYWLRFRYRPQPVSTLLFWRDVPEVRDAGMRWQKLQLPLLFFLELLAMLALVSAAVGLHVLLPEHSRPLVVILDDSLSMQAGQPTAREQAERELRELLRQRRFASLRLLLAGTTPQWLGQAVRDLHALDPMLAQWQCLQPTAALERALALAREHGGSEALVLVLTDTAPATPPEGGWLQWWAFGSANKNLAIVHALRTAGTERDRLVLEVANYASEPATATLTLRSGKTVLQTTSLLLQPGETQTLHYTVPSQAEVIEAVLDHGGLTPPLLRMRWRWIITYGSCVRLRRRCAFAWTLPMRDCDRLWSKRCVRPARSVSMKQRPSCRSATVAAFVRAVPAGWCNWYWKKTGKRLPAPTFSTDNIRCAKG